MAGSKGEQWSDTNTKRFLLYIAYALGGSPTTHFAAIAEKMGDGYTVSALQNKWHRLKTEVADAGGLNGVTAASPAAKGKKATPKKTSTDDGGVEEPKNGRGRPKRKADSASPEATPGKKVKVEASEELEEGEIKEEVVEARGEDEI